MKKIFGFIITAMMMSFVSVITSCDKINEEDDNPVPALIQEDVNINPEAVDQSQAEARG